MTSDVGDWSLLQARNTKGLKSRKQKNDANQRTDQRCALWTEICHGLFVKLNESRPSTKHQCGHRAVDLSLLGDWCVH